MTKRIYFDADCLSTFLWSGKETILYQLYSRRIFLSGVVHTELSRVKVSFFKNAVERFSKSYHVNLVTTLFETPEHNLYLEILKDSKLKDEENPNKKVIGVGEAEVLALAKINGCIAASNNLRDILYYVKKYQIEYITTADILVEALNKNFITEGQGNVIWGTMRRNSRMPCDSFTDYLLQQTDQ